MILAFGLNSMLYRLWPLIAEQVVLPAFFFAGIVLPAFGNIRFTTWMV